VKGAHRTPLRVKVTSADPPHNGQQRRHP